MTDETNDDPLSTKYVGSTASSYHDARADTPRRKAELEALDAFLSRIEPASILDLPCGTGSFFDLYLRHGSPSVLGIDVSEDMLAEAAATEAGASEAVTLRPGSAFDRELLATLDPVDLVCCIRFLNWIPQEKADQVVRSLRPLARRWMIIGVTLEPADQGLVPKLKGRLASARRARRDTKRGKVSPIVHPEPWFRSLVDELGLTVVDSRRTFGDETRVNQLHLLEV